MKDYLKITEYTVLQKLIEENKKVLIFKHSTRCPISANALEEYESFLAGDPEIICTYVDVITDRAISNEIESSLKIRHESPQAILIENGKVKWNESHQGITEQSLNKAID